MLVAHAAG